MNGSQEAKGLRSLSNIRMKTRTFSVKPIIEAKYFEEIFHGLQLNFIKNFWCWLPVFHLGLLKIGSQSEAKDRTMEMNGSQEAKGLWSTSNFCKKMRPFSVKPIIEARIL